jgi:hypothetical protein
MSWLLECASGELAGELPPLAAESGVARPDACAAACLDGARCDSGLECPCPDACCGSDLPGWWVSGGAASDAACGLPPPGGCCPAAGWDCTMLTAVGRPGWGTGPHTGALGASLVVVVRSKMVGRAAGFSAIGLAGPALAGSAGAAAGSVMAAAAELSADWPRGVPVLLLALLLLLASLCAAGSTGRAKAGRGSVCRTGCEITRRKEEVRWAPEAACCSGGSVVSVLPALAPLVPGRLSPPLPGFAMDSERGEVRAFWSGTPARLLYNSCRGC